MDYITGFTHEKTPQNNFSFQNFSVEIVIYDAYFSIEFNLKSWFQYFLTSEKIPQINFSHHKFNLENSYSNILHT